MKQLSLKKILINIIVVVGLIVLSALSLVACGGNKGNQNNNPTESTQPTQPTGPTEPTKPTEPTQPTEPPQESPTIDEYFGLDSIVSYDNTDSNLTSIDELKNFAKYKTVTFYAKKDLSFNRFSFKLKGQNPVNNSSASLNTRFETPSKGNTYWGSYNFKDDKEFTYNFYYKRATSDGTYFFSPDNKTNDPIPSTLEQVKLTKGEKITLTFGVDATGTSITGELPVSISLYVFIVE